MKTALLVFICAAALRAQQPARGVFQYRVDGYYEGQAMDPWASTATIRDSANTFTVTVEIHRGPQTHFNYSYVPGREAVWINEGRAASSTCQAPLTTEVPDFALPYVAAALPRGTTRLTILKCRSSTVTRSEVNVTVETRENAILITGPAEYPFEITADELKRVRKYVEPQGSVGVAIYTLLRQQLP